MFNEKMNNYDFKGRNKKTQQNMVKQYFTCH